MMISRTAREAGEERSWWSEPRFVLSGALFGLLVVMAIYVLASSGAGAAARGSAGASAGASPSPPSAGPGAATGSAGCSLSAGDQSMPSVGPQARWELVGSMAAPSAPSTVGPQHVVDSLSALLGGDISPHSSRGDQGFGVVR